MKAIIFNSGLGKRMGELTKNNHKAMVVLDSGETIFERQLRILKKTGIKTIIVTVGPFKEKLIEATKKEEFEEIQFIFIENKKYDKTNYIYSMFLARSTFDDDFLMLHGDLVFDKDLIKKMINKSEESICLYNEEKPLPEKDFKGRIKNEILEEVAINIFDEDCYAFQPLYKLSKKDLQKWSDEVEKFIKNKNDKVYAENALNKLMKNKKIKIKPMSYKDNYIDEIDTLEDLKRVSKEIKEFEKQFQITNNKGDK